MGDLLYHIFKNISRGKTIFPLIPIITLKNSYPIIKSSADSCFVNLIFLPLSILRPYTVGRVSNPVFKKAVEEISVTVEGITISVSA